MRVGLDVHAQSVVAHVMDVQTGEVFKVNGKMEYFHKDRLGSVAALSTDGGGKDAYYPYDPYGQPRSYNRNSNEAKANILMYVGLPRDYSTGLIRMGARWYDPTIGRFTQADPSG